ncbi:hypothetical protein [Caballeronia pedi]|uniref:hypothetical protein n=1 Tax=Caballeronia pedi TaxID=1777141 RepID=UPI0013572486|nr:hypothetical protein [Caballeronia pedi]
MSDLPRREGFPAAFDGLVIRRGFRFGSVSGARRFAPRTFEPPFVRAPYPF